MKRFVMKRKGLALPLVIGSLIMSVASVLAVNTPEYSRNNKSARNKSSYLGRGLPTLEVAANYQNNANAGAGPRDSRFVERSEGNEHYSAEKNLAANARELPKTQISKQIGVGHNSPEFVPNAEQEAAKLAAGIQHASAEQESQWAAKKNLDDRNTSAGPSVSHGQRPRTQGNQSSVRLVSDQMPSPNRENCQGGQCRTDMMALTEGMAIARNYNNQSVAFNTDGYIPDSTVQNTVVFRTYRNMGVTLDYVAGSSYAYLFSTTGGSLGYETNVKDFMAGGNIALIRNTSNRVFIYKTTGYAGWMDGIVSYTVGHNIAILKTATKVYVYSHSDGLMDTLTIPSASAFIRAGDNVAVVLSTASGRAYLYRSTGYIDYEDGISDYAVGGNMAIVRTGGRTAYVYSDAGYQGYETNITDYEAGGDMSVLRNSSDTAFTYKYNGYLYSDSSVFDYSAGGTLATVLKNNNIAYTYKFSGYYTDTNVNDFSVGGAMAVVRLWNTSGTNAYIYSDLEQVSSDIGCIDFDTGGFMATTKVATGNIYTYSDLDYLGSTNSGTYMAPGGNMAITKSSTGLVKVWDSAGQLDSFSGGVIDFIAGANMSVVGGDSSQGYKAFVYKPNAYIDYEANVKDYRVAGLYANSGGTVGISGNASLTPESFELKQNYPNPFNPSTTIKFDIGKSALVKLTIFDMLGKEMQVLKNEKLNAGSYSVVWNAGSFSSGTYFYKLEADGKVITKRMQLIK